MSAPIMYLAWIVLTSGMVLVHNEFVKRNQKMIRARYPLLFQRVRGPPGSYLRMTGIAKVCLLKQFYGPEMVEGLPKTLCINAFRRLLFDAVVTTSAGVRGRVPHAGARPPRHPLRLPHAGSMPHIQASEIAT
jgi:hypothetical protein